MALFGASSDRVTTARLRADASQFKRELASAAAAAKAFDKSLGRGSFTGGGGFDSITQDVTDLNKEVTELNRNDLIIAKRWSADLADVNRDVSDLSVSLRQVGDDADDVDFGGFDDGSDSARRLGLEIGQTENRLQLLIRAITAVGPVAVPALAAAGAGVVALAGQLTFAATGAATAVLAFDGVSDAVKALNAVSLDPSAANVEKLRLALDQLGPAGVDFVQFLHESQDALQGLQDIAGEGLFPGLEQGMSSLLDQMPQFESIVSTASTALGDLAAEAGEGFGNDQWREFFTYLATDANQILTDMGHTIGMFAEGIASMLTAFAPLTRDVSSGLEAMAERFAVWANGLDASNSGFQEFVAYVRDITPQLLATIRSLIDVFIELGEAFATVSGPALGALRIFAETLAVFLDTPIAPVLLAAASAWAAFTGAVALLRLSGILGLVSATKALATTLPLASARLGVFAAQARKLATLSRVAGGVASLGLAFTDLGQSISDSSFGNTANFAALGLLYGPAGGLIGAGVGLTMDLAGASDRLSDAMQRVNDVAADAPGDITARTAALEQMEAELEKTKDLVGDDGGAGLGLFGAKLPDWAIIGPSPDEIDESTASLEGQRAALEEMKEALSGINNLGPGPNTDITARFGEMEQVATSILPVLDRMGISLQEMQGLWTLGGDVRRDFIDDFQHAQAAMESMAGRSKGVANAIAAVDRSMLSQADSATALATALDTLTTPFLELTAARDTFAASLDHANQELSKSSSLVHGQTDAIRRNREVVSGWIAQMTDTLAAMAKHGAGSRALADEMANMIAKMREAGVQAGISGKELNEFFRLAGLGDKTIKTIFEAQGISEAENEARNLADEYNKLPRSVRVTIKQDGFPQTKKGLEDLQKEAKLTDRQVRIIASVRDNATVQLKGIQAKGKDLDKQKFTPQISVDRGEFIKGEQQARAELKALADEKSVPKLDVDISAARAHIDDVNDSLARYATQQKKTAEIDVNDDQANRAIQFVQGRLAALDATTATPTITITTVERTVKQSASGGPVRKGPGPVRGLGTSTSDSVGPFMLSDNEFVQRAAATNYYGTDAMYAINDMRADRDALRNAIGLASGGLAGLSSIRIPGLADGGRPRNRGDRLTARDVFSKTLHDPVLTLADVARALHEMRDEARDVVQAERELRREREQSRNLAQAIKEAEKRLEDQRAAVSKTREKMVQAEDGSWVPESFYNSEKSSAQASQARLRALRERQREQAKELEDAEKNLARQRDQLSDATAKLRDRERELLAQAQAISDAITAQGEIFGGSGTSVTAQGILSKLRHATQDARQFREDIAALRARGVDEDIIEQLEAEGSTPEGVQAVHNLALASRSMLRRINEQQQHLERVGASVGAWGVQQGGGGNGLMLQVQYGDITTVDFDSFNRKNVRNIRRAVRRARQP